MGEGSVRRDLRRACVLLISAVVLAGCGGSEADGPAPVTVRDSMGITLVENPPGPGADDLGWSLAAEPTVSIGTLDGEDAYQLYQVSAATVLDDGRIVIANQGSSEVRVFGNDGVHRTTWGRSGEGPGEFSRLDGLFAWRDSILTWDSRQRRASVFALDGTLGRTFPLEAPDGTSGAALRAVLPDGTLLGQAFTTFSTTDEPTSGLVRPDVTFSRHDVDGSLLLTFPPVPGVERHLIATQQFVSVMSHPFGRSTVSLVWGDGVVLSENDRYALRQYALDGSLARVVRYGVEPEVPTQQDLDAFVERTLSEIPEEERPGMRDMYEGIPLTDAAPAFEEARSDALGYLWVRDFVPPGEESNRWHVFDPEGARLGSIDLPLGVGVLEIGESWILGRWLDDFEVEYVRLYSLTR